MDRSFIYGMLVGGLIVTLTHLVTPKILPKDNIVEWTPPIGETIGEYTILDVEVTLIKVDTAEIEKTEWVKLDWEEFQQIYKATR